MTEEQEIKEILEEIRFLKSQLDELLLESGVWTARKRLAVWTNINRVKKLNERLEELKRK